MVWPLFASRFNARTSQPLLLDSFVQCLLLQELPIQCNLDGVPDSYQADRPAEDWASLTETSAVALGNA